MAKDYPEVELCRGEGAAGKEGLPLRYVAWWQGDWTYLRMSGVPNKAQAELLGRGALRGKYSRERGVWFFPYHVPADRIEAAMSATSGHRPDLKRPEQSVFLQDVDSYLKGGDELSEPNEPSLEKFPDTLQEMMERFNQLRRKV